MPRIAPVFASSYSGKLSVPMMGDQLIFLEWKANKGARAIQPFAIAKWASLALAGIWEETI
jgi:hypothetical protein